MLRRTCRVLHRRPDGSGLGTVGAKIKRRKGSTAFRDDFSGPKGTVEDILKLGGRAEKKFVAKGRVDVLVMMMFNQDASMRVTDALDQYGSVKDDRAHPFTAQDVIRIIGRRAGRLLFREGGADDEGEGDGSLWHDWTISVTDAPNMARYISATHKSEMEQEENLVYCKFVGMLYKVCYFDYVFRDLGEGVTCGQVRRILTEYTGALYYASSMLDKTRKDAVAAFSFNSAAGQIFICPPVVFPLRVELETAAQANDTDTVEQELQLRASSYPDALTGKPKASTDGSAWGVLDSMTGVPWSERFAAVLDDVTGVPQADAEAAAAAAKEASAPVQEPAQEPVPEPEQDGSDTEDPVSES